MVLSAPALAQRAQPYRQIVDCFIRIDEKGMKSKSYSNWNRRFRIHNGAVYIGDNDSHFTFLRSKDGYHVTEPNLNRTERESDPYKRTYYNDVTALDKVRCGWGCTDGMKKSLTWLQRKCK